MAVRPGTDVGDGSGYHAFLMAPLVSEPRSVIASDIQPEMPEQITEEAKRHG